MSTKINNFHSGNHFYSCQYSWLEKHKKSKASDFKEAFEPLENSWGGEHTLAKNIFINSTPTLKSQFDRKWVQKYFYKTNIQEKKKYLASLALNGIEDEKYEDVINYAYSNAKRAATWSHHNIALGKKSSRFALLSLFTGIIKQLFFSNDGEIASSDSSNLSRNDVDGDEARQWRPLAFSIINSFFRSQRNLNQYTMYSLPDDDAAMNVYQADVYGNKVAGSLAKASTFMERNINPYLMPISEILPSNVGECFRKLAVIPTSLWWRARMPAYINQEFFTDFLKYMLHKPLAVFGVGNSREEVRGIRERGNLKWSYFVDRHKENLGIADKQDEIASSALPPRNDDSPSPLITHFHNLFNKDPTTQMESSKHLGEFLAPVLGMYGFFTSALGNTSSALFRLFNIENKLFGLANLIQTSSLFSQQLIYLPKIIIPFYSETRQIENILKVINICPGDLSEHVLPVANFGSEGGKINNLRTDSLQGNTLKQQNTTWVGVESQNVDIQEDEKQKIKELKTLVRDRKITSYAGMFGFYLHGINLLLKTLSVTTSTFPRIIDESACGLTNYFFSSRRYAMGEQFRIENPEFYEVS